MFFNGWEPLARTLVVGILAYVALVLFVRISGKRTLSKMNAFDLVVTMALGSSLASILLSQKVSLAQGVAGFAVLVGMQFLGTWASVRSKFISKTLKSQPRLLVYQGQFLDEALLRERVTHQEVYSAMREAGALRVEEVAAVVLESDGSVSVIRGAPAELNVLEGVARDEKTGDS